MAKKKTTEADLTQTSEVASKVGAAVSQVLMHSGLSIQESLTAMTAGICRVIELIGPMIGYTADELATDTCNAISHYFRQGGDPLLREIAESEAHRLRGAKSQPKGS